MEDRETELIAAASAVGLASAARGGALAGLLVVEITRTTAGEFCGALLSDLGAMVVKVEPPDGSPMRRRGQGIAGEDSLYFQSENRGKYSVCAELDRTSREPWLATLFARADAVIEDLGPGTLESYGLAPDDLQSDNPVLCFVRLSPFGQTGPLAHERGDDRIAQAFGGSQYVSGFTDRHPLPCTVPLADTFSGVGASAGLLMAIRHAQRHGRGQVVDVALYEMILRVQETSIVNFDHDGTTQERAGNINPGVSPSNIYPTRDGGFFALSGAGDQPFKRLCEAIEAPEAYSDPRFSSSASRIEHRTAIDTLVAKWIANHDLADVEARFTQADATGAPLNSAAELLANEHFNARQAFIDLVSPTGTSFRAPAPQPRLVRTPAAAPGPAPRLGEHTDSIRELMSLLPQVARESSVSADAPDMPLTGLRVIDLARILAGPVAATFLADFGADVIVIELPEAGGTTTRFGPEGVRPGYMVTNRNRRSVTLDVRNETGREALFDLVRNSDVLVENFRPGTLERWGIGPDELLKINPRLVILRASGFGQTGPLSKRSAFNPVGLAYGGLMYLGGWRDRSPLRDGLQAGDYSTALFGFLGTTAALLRRERDGQGQVVDTAMCEAILRQTGDVIALESALGLTVERDDGAWATNPVTLTALASDGVYVAISGDSWDRTIEQLHALTGAPCSSIVEAGERFRAFVTDQDSQEAVAALRAAGLPSSTVNSAAMMYDNQHMWTRGSLVTVEHPEFGAVVMQGVLPALTETPGRVRFWSPFPGSDNEAVFGGLLGYTTEKIDRLTRPPERGS